MKNLNAKILVFFAVVFFAVPAYCQDSGDFQKATIKAAALVGKSVVSINCLPKEPQGKEELSQIAGSGQQSSPDSSAKIFEDLFGANSGDNSNSGLGSGVIIEPNGYILTNEHVIADAGQILVKLPDGRQFDAQLKGVDKRNDLAVIKINASGLSAAKLGDSDKLEIGEWVIAIGNPFGFAIENPEPTVTVGVVSALHRSVPALGRKYRGYDGLIQTDAAINPGNSGGPLVNFNCEVVGINAAIISSSGGYQGIGFAIPSNKAKKVLSQLIKGQQLDNGWLGVAVQDLSDELRAYFSYKKPGVLVVKVDKGSPAKAGGIKESDIIIEFEKQPVTSSKDLEDLLTLVTVGKQVDLKIIREGKEISIALKLGKVPDADQVSEPEVLENSFVFAGLSLAPVSIANKSGLETGEDTGLAVLDVLTDSPAELSGVSAGDVISRVDDTIVNSKEEFLSAVKGKNKVLLKTNSGFFVLKIK